MVTDSRSTIRQLAGQLAVGDLVFIRVPTPPFMQVADATGSWTNHVGVVIDPAGTIAESRFPICGTTSLHRFLRRSTRGRVAVARLPRPLTAMEQQSLSTAVRRRAGIIYDTGFNLHSRRQFCSRYAREVLFEATGERVGTVQSFAELLGERPEAPVWFWQVWYLGRIPWQRQTVTPASVLSSAALEIVFDGHAR